MAIHKIPITGQGSSIVVDEELSSTSKNPVQNKIVTNALAEKQPIGDYALRNEIPVIPEMPPSVTVDSVLSTTSENPVQNKVITAYLNQLTARVVALELGREIKITKQPENTTAYTGGTYSFSVVAESGLPLSYLWYFKGESDTDFKETTNTSSNYTATTTSDVIGATWQFKCKISNGIYTVWSEIGTLTIIEQPVQPVTISLSSVDNNNYKIAVKTNNIELPRLWVSQYYGTENGTAKWFAADNGQLLSSGQIVECPTNAAHNPTKLRVIVGVNIDYTSNEIILT